MSVPAGSREVAGMFGVYTVGSGLGKGAQGRVKLGTHQETGRQVALKFIPKSYLRIGPRESAAPRGLEHPNRLLRNLHREVKALMRVGPMATVAAAEEEDVVPMEELKPHPNITEVLDLSWDSGLRKKHGEAVEPAVLLVLEWAPHMELFEYVALERFSHPLAHAYFKQLATGLAHCHAKGVYHRDIKPENLLLGHDFVLKVADFGLAILDEAATGAPLVTRCGTDVYMSPEVFGRKPYTGPAADVWSAGIVLFVMLAGFPPFNHAAEGDWWFDAITSGLADAFWAAHERTVTFPPLAKALLTKIFESPDASRPTMEDVLKHPYVTDTPAMDPASLISEMSRRLAAVTHTKAVERDLARRKRAEAQRLASRGARPAAVLVPRSIVLDGAGLERYADLPVVEPLSSRIVDLFSLHIALPVTETLSILDEGFEKLGARAVLKFNKLTVALPASAVGEPITLQIKLCQEAVESSRSADDLALPDVIVLTLQRQEGSSFVCKLVYDYLCQWFGVEEMPSVPLGPPPL